MGIFDFLKGSNINDGVKKFKETNGAVLLDVRTREEYNQGRIPGSVNIPVSDIHRIDSEITVKIRLCLYIVSVVEEVDKRCLT